MAPLLEEVAPELGFFGQYGLRQGRLQAKDGPDPQGLEGDLMPFVEAGDADEAEGKNTESAVETNDLLAHGADRDKKREILWMA